MIGTIKMLDRVHLSFHMKAVKEFQFSTVAYMLMKCKPAE